LVRKANALEEETRWAHDYINNIINPYTWQMLWQGRHFRLVSSTRRMTTDRVCHIMLNRKLLPIIYPKLH